MKGEGFESGKRINKHMRRFPIICCIVIVTLITSCGHRPSNVIVIDPEPGISRGDAEMLDASKRHLKVAVSAILSPRETFSLYEDLFAYIGESLGMPVEFHQRPTYQEINEMLEQGQLDFAFICSGAYIDLDQEKGVQLLAVPVTGGRTVYQAYIIVPASSPVQTFLELRNSNFAYTDPMSNTGYLYVLYRLKELNETKDEFFASTMFTYGHDISIQMVGRGIVDGASVNQLVFDYLKEKHPQRVQDVRIIEVSESYGLPPVVVSNRMAGETRERLLQLFLHMHEDEQVREILQDLRIEKFLEGRDEDYHTIRYMRDMVSVE